MDAEWMNKDKDCKSMGGQRWGPLCTQTIPAPFPPSPPESQHNAFNGAQGESS